MGMAASQARFLTLTARKSNVEYEGQQVNQQRTSLANESAGLFNKMMELQVPTPPSATDYYNTRYTFGNSGYNFSIASMSAGVGSKAGTYNVTINYSTNELTGYRTANTTPLTFTKDDSGKYVPQYAYTDGIIDDTGAKAPFTAVAPTLNEDGTYTYNDNNVNAIIKMLGKDAVPGDTYYYYKDANSKYQYISSSTIKSIESQITEKDGKYRYESTSGLASYYAQDATVNKTATGTARFPDTTTDGRFETLILSNMECEDPEIKEALEGTKFDLSLTQVQDDEGYSEAMKDYEYQKMLYERTINDINAQTEVIQQQDRTLELRLKQLDTEQNALNTELEAVKKVIETNVEATFKTFA